MSRIATILAGLPCLTKVETQGDRQIAHIFLDTELLVGGSARYHGFAIWGQRYEHIISLR